MTMLYNGTLRGIERIICLVEIVESRLERVRLIAVWDVAVRWAVAAGAREQHVVIREDLHQVIRQFDGVVRGKLVVRIVVAVVADTSADAAKPMVLALFATAFS